ncbi:hypothetical protein ONS95_003768 [Cadophora gregata]|uniref:uncharacterized protein n=1 Tax=Cadophora gregata TaxID=51156 RepID=UPI0026DCA1C5|nr:uncharacterized protein ONS95_003768 [Cadophora gregata]KAK0107058.1 hypothetical protein ONS95_003768 [Cadophora gregata]KAK0116746.1 hypothetical protein ONS96_012597 [Cadophora gregata f. sp. sojae]
MYSFYARSQYPKILYELGYFELAGLTLYSVTNYSTKTATLTLEHNHPLGNTIKAQVDVNLLVTTLKSNETQIGEWVNVMGYITGGQKHKVGGEQNVEIGVQALVLWSAGPINLAGYEKSLDEKAVDEQTARKEPKDC